MKTLIKTAIAIIFVGVIIAVMMIALGFYPNTL